MTVCSRVSGSRVLSLGFATVLEILSGSLRNTVRAREYTEAALTAQSVMDMVDLEIPLEVGTTASGESGDYQWELNVYDYSEVVEDARAVELAELTGVDLLQIELQVSWGQPPREKTSSFSTLRALMVNRIP